MVEGPRIDVLKEEELDREEELDLFYETWLQPGAWGGWISGCNPIQKAETPQGRGPSEVEETKGEDA